MSFLHPALFAAALAAVALPVVVHWLTRPRPVSYRLSTLRLLREVVRQRRAKDRLRDWIVLALRAAAVALVGAALARPFLGERLVAESNGATSIRRVVLLDISQSMASTHGATPLVQPARSRAAQLLAYRPGLEANLILAGAKPRAAFRGLSTNFRALGDELARAEVRPERLNIQAALAAAGQMLAETGSTEVRRELVVIGDFQRTNWAAADFSAVPKGVEIQLESVAPPAPAENLAVLKAGCPGGAILGREARLKVEVGNFAAKPARVEVELTLGPASYRLKGLCPAGERLTLGEEVVLDRPGWQVGAARLIGVEDAMPADNTRPVAIEVRASPTFALVTREPPGAAGASSFYLERALSPLAQRQAAHQPKVVRVDPARWDDQPLATAELAVLDHPGKLPEAAVAQIVSLVRRGRSLLYVACEPVDAVNLKQLAAAAGSAWPARVEFLPPQAGSQRRELTLADVRRELPPFRVFGDELAGTLSTLRFSPALGSQRLDSGPSDELLASYSDRSAALVVGSLGAGAVAIWNIDLARSNLPRSAAFVPWVGELVDRLLGQSRRDLTVESGEPLSIFLPPEAGAAAGLKIAEGLAASRAKLMPPESLGALVEEPGGLVWRAAAAGPPSAYQVRRGEQTVFALSSVLAEEESDLRPLALDVIRQRLSAGRSVTARSLSSGEQQRDEWWPSLAVACLVCMLLELAALRVART
jgi:hypothetical protein